MAKKLERETLWSLEQYAEARDSFRRDVIAHKQARRLALGEHITLLFEDYLTMQYQVQEMLRTERIFEAAEIEEELESYNPLIPDGSNWKATMLIEYPDVEERKRALAALGGIEHSVWLEVDGGRRSLAIANEDMERSRDEKAAAVHFLRFELDADSVAALKAGAGLRAGVDHPKLATVVDPVPEATRLSLLEDLD